MTRSLAAIAVVALASLAPLGDAAAQRRVVVNADEWTLSDAAISTSTHDGVAFARNVRNWLTGGTSGNILAFSNNFGLTGGTLASTMNSDGYTWTVVNPGDAAASATAWANLSSYRAVFIGGNAVPSLSDLTAYVNGGGSVYLLAGSGTTGAIGTAEESIWDPFLAMFGLEFGPSYNNFGGTLNTSAFASQGPFGSALFTGVNELFQDNGNDVLTAGALPANATRQVFTTSQRSVFGAGELRLPSTSVPEPSTYALLGAGLAVLGVMARRRRAT